MQARLFFRHLDRSWRGVAEAAGALENVVDLTYGENADGWGAGWALLLPLRQS